MMLHDNIQYEHGWMLINIPKEDKSFEKIRFLNVRVIIISCFYTIVYQRTVYAYNYRYILEN